MAGDDTDPCMTDGCRGTVRYVNSHRTGNAQQPADIWLLGQCPVCDQWQKRVVATGEVIR